MTREEVFKKVESWCKEGRVKYDVLTCMEKDKKMVDNMESSLDGYDLYPKVPNEFKIQASEF
jgi:hypothetical protein